MFNLLARPGAFCCGPFRAHPGVKRAIFLWEAPDV